MNINELIKEAHENAVAHGWWEEEQPFEELNALMHSELSEALEEFRDGRGMDEIYCYCFLGFTNKEIDPTRNHKCNGCKYGKPEGIPIELADVIIRIADYFGRHKMQVDELKSRATNQTVREKIGTLCELIAHGHWLLGMAYVSKEEELRYSLMALLVDHIRDFCQRNRIDLEKAINIKMRYNKLFPDGRKELMRKPLKELRGALNEDEYVKHLKKIGYEEVRS